MQTGNKRNLPAIHILYFMAVFAVGVIPAVGQVDSLNREFRQIQTKEQALEQAYRLTGFPALDSMSRAGKAPDVVTSMIMRDTITPFLHDQIDGRAVWRTSVKQMPLACPHEGRYHHQKDWEIFIDSNTGQFLMAVGKAPGSDTLLTRLPTAEEAEAQLINVSDEYVGLPSEPSLVTLYDALETVVYPHTSAQQVFVRYVLYSHNQSTPKAIWVIYMRSPHVICGLDLPHGKEYMGMNMRALVDAQTGEFKFATNTPYPQLENWPEKEGGE